MLCLFGAFHSQSSYFVCVSYFDLSGLMHLYFLFLPIFRLDWPVRTISFSHDGRLLASASEDLIIDIAEVETGEKVAEIGCESPTFTVSWHPKKPLLAFACDDKTDDRDRDRGAGTVKLFGLPGDH